MMKIVRFDQKSYKDVDGFQLKDCDGPGKSKKVRGDNLIINNESSDQLFSDDVDIGERETKDGDCARFACKSLIISLILGFCLFILFLILILLFNPTLLLEKKILSSS